MIHQNSWDGVEGGLKKKLIALNMHVRNETKMK